MEVMETVQKVQAGSNLPAPIIDAKPAENMQKENEVKPQLSAGSFSTYYTWRGFGTVNLNCGHGAIRANSRVFVSLTEYNTDPNINPIMGNAFIFLYNVVPYNGGVVVRFNVGFGSALNIKVSVLVDP
jgi:hypothetical protein